MKDMKNVPISIGDTVVFPDGNARYGGLYLRAGVVEKLTEKRVTVKSVKLPDGDKPKTTAKTGAKLLVLPDHFLLGLINETE